MIIRQKITGITITALILMGTPVHGREPADIRTVKVYPSKSVYEAAVISLNSPDEKIIISFDELGDTPRSFRFELIHCDADWQPEELSPTELTDGFNEGLIAYYEHSRGTITQYINYRLELPDGNLKPKLSGNWIARIFDEEDPDRTLIAAKFMVSEDAVGISGNATGMTDRGYNTEFQQLEITVDRGRSDVVDLTSDLKIRVSQNNRTDDIRSLSAPLRLEGSKAIFAHDNQLIFEGGKEYRRFETTSLNFPGMRVAETVFANDHYQAILETDHPRTETGYEYDSTQQGHYTIAADGTSSPDIEAEYVETQFRFASESCGGTSIYLEGELTGGAPRKLVYNPESGLHELWLQLKQGSYNYQYLSRSQEGKLSPTNTEGNSYQTRNTYNIGVYYKPMGSRYTRLLGHTTIK